LPRFLASRIGESDIVSSFGLLDFHMRVLDLLKRTQSFGLKKVAKNFGY